MSRTAAESFIWVFCFTSKSVSCFVGYNDFLADRLAAFHHLLYKNIKVIMCLNMQLWPLQVKQLQLKEVFIWKTIIRYSSVLFVRRVYRWATRPKMIGTAVCAPESCITEILNEALSLLYNRFPGIVFIRADEETILKTTNYLKTDYDYKQMKPSGFCRTNCLSSHFRWILKICPTL